MAGTVFAPALAVAQPAPAPVAPEGLTVESLTQLAAAQAALPEGVTYEALASIAPAIIGAIAGATTPVADAVAEPSPQAALLAQAKQLLESSQLPPQIKSLLLRIVQFLDGSGGGGPTLPPQDGPAIAQFLWPTIGKGCISDSADSVGTALAVAGPAHLPPPGPKAGQAGFVFTALGTKPANPVQNAPLTLQWFNIDNRRTATQPLTNDAKINPDGPTTLSTIADTGPGRVLAVISGSITTGKDAEARTCSFIPTVGFFNVG